jgi:methyl-accepting chemotaxis protein
MTIGDFFGGLGHGLASLVGFGQLTDPLGDLNGELSSSIQKMNTMTATQSAAFATDVTQSMKDLNTIVNEKSDYIKQYVDYNNELLWNSEKEQNIFIGTIAAIVIIIIFFMLIQKKCC